MGIPKSDEKASEVAGQQFASANKSTTEQTTGSDALSAPIVRRSLAQQYYARFGTDNPAAMFERTLTPAEVARVESLMGVPMHKLSMLDAYDRETLSCQRSRAALGALSWHRDKEARERDGPWAYWSRLFASHVNMLPLPPERPERSTK